MDDFKNSEPQYEPRRIDDRRSGIDRRVASRTDSARWLEAHGLTERRTFHTMQDKLNYVERRQHDRRFLDSMPGAL